MHWVLGEPVMQLPHNGSQLTLGDPPENNEIINLAHNLQVSGQHFAVMATNLL